MLLTAYRLIAYYGTLAGFGVLALAFNLGCCLRWRAGNVRTERSVRLAIHRMFRRLTRWFAFAHLVEIEYRGFETTRLEGTVLVANHPGLLDAVYFLALVPNAVCVFKPAIRRNLLLGPAAVRAGYLPSDHQLTLVRAAAKRIRADATFVVFPEGTRTPASGEIGRFKPGFALIARHAGAPVQLVRITVTRDFYTKEASLWRLPPLPVHVVLQAGPCLDPATAPSLPDFVAGVEAWYRQPLPVGPGNEVRAFPPATSTPTLTPS